VECRCGSVYTLIIIYTKYTASVGFPSSLFLFLTQLYNITFTTHQNTRAMGQWGNVVAPTPTVANANAFLYGDVDTDVCMEVPFWYFFKYFSTSEKVPERYFHVHFGINITTSPSFIYLNVTLYQLYTKPRNALLAISMPEPQDFTSSGLPLGFPVCFRGVYRPGSL